MRFMFAKFKKEIIDYLFMFHSDIQNIVYLARFNRLDLCEIVYLETDAFNGIDEVVNYASCFGNLEIVKYLTAIGASCSTYAMDWAARNGHLDIVQWLHLNRSEGCTTEAMDWAANNGRLDVLKWLHFNRSEGCTTRAMDWAAEFGHLDIVQWLHLNRYEGCSEYAMIDAVRNGHIAIVKYLYENSLVTDRDTLRYAMEYAKALCYTEIEIYLELALALNNVFQPCLIFINHFSNFFLSKPSSIFSLSQLMAKTISREIRELVIYKAQANWTPAMIAAELRLFIA